MEWCIGMLCIIHLQKMWCLLMSMMGPLVESRSTTPLAKVKFSQAWCWQVLLTGLSSYGLLKVQNLWEPFNILMITFTMFVGTLPILACLLLQIMTELLICLIWQRIMSNPSPIGKLTTMLWISVGGMEMVRSLLVEIVPVIFIYQFWLKDSVG